MAALFWIGFAAIVAFLIWRIRAPIRKANAYMEQGLMSRHLKHQAFNKSLSGVLFTARDDDLNNIFNRLDRSFLASNEIYPKIDLPAGMILFETKYLKGARLRYVGPEGELTVFEFKAVDIGKFTGNAQLPEITCNIILTALEKAIAL